MQYQQPAISFEGHAIWLHPDLAIYFANWIDPEFGTAVERFIDEALSDDYQEVARPKIPRKFKTEEGQANKSKRVELRSEVVKCFESWHAENSHLCYSNAVEEFAATYRQRKAPLPDWIFEKRPTLCSRTMLRWLKEFEPGDFNHRSYRDRAGTGIFDTNQELRQFALECLEQGYSPSSTCKAALEKFGTAPGPRTFQRFSLAISYMGESDKTSSCN